MLQESPRLQFPSHRLCDLALEKIVTWVFGLKIDISNLEGVPVANNPNFSE